MRCAGRLEKGLADLEGLHGTAGKLRADLAPGDVSRDRPSVAVGAGKSTRPVENAYDGDTLAGYVRQGIGADRFDGVESGPGGFADGA